MVLVSRPSAATLQRQASSWSKLEVGLALGALPDGGPCHRRGPLAWAAKWRALVCRRAFLPVFLSYFTFWGGCSLLLPMVGVYLQSKGLGAFEIALIGCVAQLLAAVVRTAIALLADRTGLHRPITVAALVMAGACFSLLVLVPVRQEAPSASDAPAAPPKLSNDKLNASLMDATPTMPNASVRHERPQHAGGLSARGDASFWLAFVSRSAGLLFLNPVINLSDALALAVTSRVFEIKGPPGVAGSTEKVEREEEEMGSAEHELRAELKHEYMTGEWLEITVPRKESASNASGPIDKNLELCHESKLLSNATIDLKAMVAEQESVLKRQSLEQKRDRAYGLFCAVGAVGWLMMSGSAALVTEILVPSTAPGDVFLWSLVAALAFWVLTAIAICLFRPATIHAGEELFSHVVQFVRHPEAIRLFALLFVEGFFQGVLDTNLYLFIAELGGGVSLVYLTTFTLSASEVVALSGSQLVLERIGHSMAHLLVLCAYGLRFVGYALSPGAEWTLLAAPLHSVTTGLQWMAMAAQVAVLAPPGAHTSALGLAYGVQSGPGAAFGYLLGGLLFGAIGARALFWASAALALAALALFTALHVRLRRLDKAHGLCASAPTCKAAASPKHTASAEVEDTSETTTAEAA